VIRGARDDNRVFCAKSDAENRTIVTTESCLRDGERHREKKRGSLDEEEISDFHIWRISRVELSGQSFLVGVSIRVGRREGKETNQSR
jgi:hypothetical protein